MRLTVSFLAAVALALALTPAALADSIQLDVNSSFLANVSSPNDNYWADYSTAYSPPFRSPILIKSFVTAFFPSVSVVVPAGDTIISAIIEVLLPTPFIQGTGSAYIGGGLPPPDWTSPSVAPTIGEGGSSSVDVELGYQPNGLRPIIDGNEVSTGDLNINFDLSGSIEGNVGPGTNWAGYIGGSGQVDIPYTVELDVTYTPAPVPEPSSVVLFGTGLLGLAEVARRRFLS